MHAALQLQKKTEEMREKKNFARFRHQKSEAGLQEDGVKAPNPHGTQNPLPPLALQPQLPVVCKSAPGKSVGQCWAEHPIAELEVDVRTSLHQRTGKTVFSSIYVCWSQSQ